MKSPDKVFKSIVQFYFLYAHLELWKLKKENRTVNESVFQKCGTLDRFYQYHGCPKTDKSMLEEIKPTMPTNNEARTQLIFTGKQQLLEKDIMVGRPEGTRSRGRPAMLWLTSIITTTRRTQLINSDQYPIMDWEPTNDLNYLTQFKARLLHWVEPLGHHFSF